MLELIYKNREQFKKQPFAAWQDSRAEYLDHLRKSHTSLYFCVGEISQILEIGNQHILSRCVTDLFNSFNELFESNNNYLESKLLYFKRLEEREKEILKLEYHMKHTFLKNNAMNFNHQDMKNSNFNISSKDIAKLQYEALQLKDKKNYELEKLKAKQTAVRNFIQKGYDPEFSDFDVLDEEEAEEMKKIRERRLKEKVDNCLVAMDDMNNSNFLDLMFEPKVIVEVSKQVYKNLIDRSKENVKKLSRTVERLSEYGHVEPTAAKALNCLVEEVKSNTPEFEDLPPSSKGSIFLRKKYVDEVLRSTENSLKECFQKNNEKIALKAIRAYLHASDKSKKQTGCQTMPNKQITQMKFKLKKLKKDIAEKQRKNKIALDREIKKNDDLVEKTRIEVRMKTQYCRELNEKISTLQSKLHSANSLNEKMEKSVLKMRADTDNYKEIAANAENSLEFVIDNLKKVKDLLGGINQNLHSIFSEGEKSISSKKDDPITLNKEGIKSLGFIVENIWKFLNKISIKEMRDSKPYFDVSKSSRKKIKIVKPIWIPKKLEVPKSFKKKRKSIKKKSHGSKNEKLIENLKKQEKLHTVNLSIYSEMENSKMTSDHSNQNTSYQKQSSRRGSIEMDPKKLIEKNFNSKNKESKFQKRWSVGPDQQLQLTNKLNSYYKTGDIKKIEKSEENEIQNQEETNKTYEENLYLVTGEQGTKDIKWGRGAKNSRKGKKKKGHRSKSKNRRSSKASSNKSKSNKKKNISSKSQKEKKYVKNSISKERRQEEAQESTQKSMEEKLRNLSQYQAKETEDNFYNEEIEDSDSTLVMGKYTVEGISAPRITVMNEDGETLLINFDKSTQTENFSPEEILAEISSRQFIEGNNGKNGNSFFSDGPLIIPKKFLASTGKFSKNKKESSIEFYGEDEEKEALVYIESIISALKINKKSKIMLKKIFRFIISGDQKITQAKENYDQTTESFNKKSIKSKKTIKTNTIFSKKDKKLSTYRSQQILNLGIQPRNEYKKPKDMTYRNKYGLRKKNFSMNETELINLKTSKKGNKLPNLMKKEKSVHDYSLTSKGKTKWRYKSYDENIPSENKLMTHKEKYFMGIKNKTKLEKSKNYNFNFF